MKAGGSPPVAVRDAGRTPPSSVFFSEPPFTGSIKKFRIRRRNGSAAVCKAVALRSVGVRIPPGASRGGVSSKSNWRTPNPHFPVRVRASPPHAWEVGHGQAKQSRKLSEPYGLLRVRLPHLPLLFGGAAQKVVQRRAKPPGVRAPVRSSRTASAIEVQSAECRVQN